MHRRRWRRMLQPHGPEAPPRGAHSPLPPRRWEGAVLTAPSHPRGRRGLSAPSPPPAAHSHTPGRGLSSPSAGARSGPEWGCSSFLEISTQMEFVQLFFIIAAVAVVGAVVVVGALMVKSARSMQWTLESMQMSLQAAADKLSYLEGRMENAVQDGRETCRHLLQIVTDYKMESGSVLWAYRQTVEQYVQWRAARLRAGLPPTSTFWNLVVQSTIEWVHCEVSREYEE